MTNCKHGNGPDCLQCQYEQDEKLVKDTRHEAWELWECNNSGDILWRDLSTSPSFNMPELIRYRRRHDADEIIKEWKQEKRRKNYKPVSVLRDEWLAREGDKCATCRPAPPKPMWEEPEPGTEYFWFNIYKKRVNRATWNEWIQHRERLNACLCHATRESAQEWLDWWNEAVGRKA